MKWVKIEFNKEFLEAYELEIGAKELSEIIDNFKSEGIIKPILYPAVGSSIDPEESIVGSIRRLKLSKGDLYAKIYLNKMMKDFIKNKKVIYRPCIGIGYRSLENNLVQVFYLHNIYIEFVI